MRFTLVVVESSDRWTRIAKAFALSALPEDSDQLQIVSTNDTAAALQELSRDRNTVAVWELPKSDPSRVLRNVSHVRFADGNVQFVSLPSESYLSPEVRASLHGHLLELGASAVLCDATDFLRVLPFIRRSWSAADRTAGLTTVQQIWERLPWDPVHTAKR